MNKNYRHYIRWKRPLGRPRRRWEDNIKTILGSGMWGYGLDQAGSG